MTGIRVFGESTRDLRKWDVHGETCKHDGKPRDVHDWQFGLGYRYEDDPVFHRPEMLSQLS